MRSIYIIHYFAINKTSESIVVMNLSLTVVIDKDFYFFSLNLLKCINKNN